MLRYFKKYVWAAYALSVLIPAASLAAFSVVMGGNVVKTLPGLFSSLMLFFACLYVMPRLMGQLADRKAEQLVSLYNDGCDPDAFRAQAAAPARAIGEPYTEAGSWFLSFYALALADGGQVEEAARIGEGLSASAAQAEGEGERAALLVNMEPVVQRLLGERPALGAVEEAERLLEGDASAEAVRRRRPAGLEARARAGDRRLPAAHARAGRGRRGGRLPPPGRRGARAGMPAVRRRARRAPARRARRPRPPRGAGGVTGARTPHMPG